MVDQVNKNLLHNTRVIGKLKTVLSKLRKFRLLILLILLIGLVCSSIWIFTVINKVPSKVIEMELSAEGDIKAAGCVMKIDVNYEKEPSSKNRISEANSVIIEQILDSVAKPLSLKYDNRVLKGNPKKKEEYKFLMAIPPEYYESLRSVFFLKYGFSSNYDYSRGIPMFKNLVHGDLDIDRDYLTYCSKIKTDTIGNDVFAYGISFIGFTGNKAVGGGGMSFSTSYINNKPGILSLWDISKSIFRINFHHKEIYCNKLVVDFHHPTVFSSMYPVPDKMTAHSIEYNNQNKINEIEHSGIVFVSEFVGMKHLQEVRNFILTAILSILLALICEIIVRTFKL